MLCGHLFCVLSENLSEWTIFLAAYLGFQDILNYFGRYIENLYLFSALNRRILGH